MLSNYINRDYTFHLNRETDKLVRNITLATDKIVASIRNILMLINESLLFIFLIILMASINFKILLYLISIVAIPIFIVGPFLKTTLIKLGDILLTTKPNHKKNFPSIIYGKRN